MPESSVSFLKAVQGLRADICSVTLDPMSVLDALSQRMAGLALTAEVKAEASTCLEEMKSAYQQASTVVEPLLVDIQKAIEHSLALYKQKHGDMADYKPYAVNVSETMKHFNPLSEKQGILASFLTAYDLEWVQLKAHGALLKENLGLHSFKEHSLVFALTANDNEFLDFLEAGCVPIGDEVGLLMLARLRDMRRKPNLLRRVNRLLKRVPLDGPDAIFSFNAEAARIELIKLKMFSLLNPDRKVAWVGTATAVDQLIARRPTIHAYFNPDPKTHTWALNRIWLLGVSAFGFRVELAEHQQPAIIRALHSSSNVHFILELLKHARRPKHGSQYTRGVSPTATSQEIMLLLSLRYRLPWGDSLILERQQLVHDSSCFSAPLFHRRASSVDFSCAPLHAIEPLPLSASDIATLKAEWKGGMQLRVNRGP